MQGGRTWTCSLTALGRVPRIIDRHARYAWLVWDQRRATQLDSKSQVNSLVQKPAIKCTESGRDSTCSRPLPPPRGHGGLCATPNINGVSDAFSTASFSSSAAPAYSYTCGVGLCDSAPCGNFPAAGPGSRQLHSIAVQDVHRNETSIVTVV